MRHASSVIGAVLPLVLAGAALAGTSTAPRTERVSVSSSGAQGDRGGAGVALSEDGRFAAVPSDSRNLVPRDTNGKADVFLRDLKTHKTQRVSISSSGRQGNDHSYGASISSDGRYVAFTSAATNLVSGRDRDGHGIDAFIRDRKLHKTIRVSISSSGKQGGAGSVAISGDGRSVVFVSRNELAPEDRRNAHRDVFVRNLRTHKTELVSVALGGTAADWYSDDPRISADGRFVAFTSRATNLVSADKHRVTDIYVRDLKTHRTTLVSVSSSGGTLSRRSLFSSISADGRFVAFSSIAPNVVAGDTNELDDVFLRDLKNGTTERISLSTSGAQSVTDHSYVGPVSVSAHGEFVAFQSGATEFVPGDANDTRYDIFIRDVANHTTSRVSVNTAGVQGNDNSNGPALSADGRFVGFWSQATNLATPDTNHRGDPFVRGPLRP